MKALLSLLFSAFIFTSCSSQGYSPAFEADHVFKTEVEKWTFHTDKFGITPFYFDACDEDTSGY